MTMQPTFLWKASLSSFITSCPSAPEFVKPFTHFMSVPWSMAVCCVGNEKQKPRIIFRLPGRNLLSPKDDHQLATDCQIHTLCTQLATRLQGVCTLHTACSHDRRRNGWAQGLPMHFLCKCQQLVDNVVEQLLCTKKNPTISSEQQNDAVWHQLQEGWHDPSAPALHAPAGQCRISSGMGFSSYSTTSWKCGEFL